MARHTTERHSYFTRSSANRTRSGAIRASPEPNASSIGRKRRRTAPRAASERCSSAIGDSKVEMSMDPISIPDTVYSPDSAMAGPAMEKRSKQARNPKRKRRENGENRSASTDTTRTTTRRHEADSWAIARILNHHSLAGLAGHLENRTHGQGTSAISELNPIAAESGRQCSRQSIRNPSEEAIEKIAISPSKGEELETDLNPESCDLVDSVGLLNAAGNTIPHQVPQSGVVSGSSSSFDRPSTSGSPTLRKHSNPIIDLERFRYIPPTPLADLVNSTSCTGSDLSSSRTIDTSARPVEQGPNFLKPGEFARSPLQPIKIGHLSPPVTRMILKDINRYTPYPSFRPTPLRKSFVMPSPHADDDNKENVPPEIKMSTCSGPDHTFPSVLEGPNDHEDEEVLQAARTLCKLSGRIAIPQDYATTGMTSRLWHTSDFPPWQRLLEAMDVWADATHIPLVTLM